MQRKVPKSPNSYLMILVVAISLAVVIVTSVFSFHIFKVAEQYTSQSPQFHSVSGQQTNVSELLNHLSLLQVSLLNSKVDNELIEHLNNRLSTGLQSYRNLFYPASQNDLIFQIDFSLSQLTLQLQNPKFEKLASIQLANSARNDLFLLQRNLIQQEADLFGQSRILLDDITRSVRYGFILAAAVFVYTVLFFASSKKSADIRYLLQQSNSYLELVINNTQAAVLVIDESRNIIDVNQTVECLTKFKAEQLLGQHIDILLDSESIEQLAQACETSDLSNTQRYGVSMHTQDGEEQLVDVSYATVLSGKKTISVIVLRAVSDQQKLNQELVENQKVLAQSQSIAKFGSWHWDLNQNRIDWSEAVESIYGLSKFQLGNSFNNIVNFVHPEDKDHVVDAIQNTVVLKSDFNISYRLVINHEVRYIEEVGKAYTDENGDVISILGTVRDVTLARQVNEQLSMSESVFANAQDGILVTDSEGQIQRINTAFTRLTGYQEEDALGTFPHDLLQSSEINPTIEHPYWQQQNWQGEWHGEWWQLKANGEPFLTDQYITEVVDEDGKVVRYLAIINDITEKRKLEEVMRQKAYFDGLTNLPNRSLFHDRLKMKLNDLKRKPNSFALCFLDLDGFKAINDTHGHDMGDQVLIRTAQRLSDSIRESDTVSRLAGDEFTLILDNIEDASTAVNMAEKLIQKVNRDITYEGITVTVGASFGVVLVNEETPYDMNLLIKQADHAMYQAKTAGKNRAVLFDPKHIN